MKIEITPFDTLFFKDAKPFTMGEDTWATGSFPPSPAVIYGMLRTTYAAQNNISLANIEVATKDLRINSLHLKTKNGLLFPYPADIFQPKEENGKRGEINIMKLKRNSIISNIDIIQYPFILSPETNKKLEDNFDNDFFDKISFDNYINSVNNDFLVTKRSELIELEPKIGIARDKDSNQIYEGRLYRVGMLRIREGVKILVDFENLELELKGFLKFGAENKMAHYEVSNEAKIKLPEIKNEFVKLYLATPAIFKNGSIPEFISNRNFDGIDFELLTMAIGKPLFIGGFDMKNRKPKPMKKAVPAGSVYYLKCSEAKVLVEKLHGKSISEIYPEQGFGICYCGTFNLDRT
ncbi:MAG: type III-B CRISPR module-associated protein Cmr3 [Candidatus Delongbacteria bacterium]|nr:type III-B CRISPR module-associated protein Cmr3 [Candidatus Delongbacteria bacterium]